MHRYFEKPFITTLSSVYMIARGAALRYFNILIILVLLYVGSIHVESVSMLFDSSAAVSNNI